MVPQRVTLICNSYPPEIGAAPARMYGLAQLLRRAGHDVTVISGMPSYPLGRVFASYRGRLQVTEVQDGITVHRLPYLPSQAPNRLLRLGSLATLAASLRLLGLKCLRQARPDVVVVSSPPLPLARVGAALARKVGARLLLNVSDLWPMTARELGALRPGLLYRRLERMETALFRSAAAWMGQSDEILTYMRSRVEPAKPAFLYRNLPPASPADTVSMAPGTIRRIVYAGLLGPVQGIARIATEIDFAALSLELHLYGDGPDHQLLESFTQQHPQRGVRLHAALPAAAMAGQLRDYDAALVPLRRPIYGAIPSKLFTAAEAGLPILFQAGGEGARLVEAHGLGWTVPPGDLQALTATLRVFQEAPTAMLAAVRGRCRTASQGAFDRKAQDTAFLGFFEAHVQQPASRPRHAPRLELKKIRATISLIISAILAPFQKI